MSPAHGYACDSFRSLEVVLPTGQLVTATRTNEYSDLFRALKGGGSRFGIVTKFEVDAIHTGTALDKTWYGGIVQVYNSFFSGSFAFLILAIVQYSSSSALALVQATDKASRFFACLFGFYSSAYAVVHLHKPRSQSW